MDLINSIIWLAAGAMIGWFANRFFATLLGRRANKINLPFVDLSIKDKNPDLIDAPMLTPLAVKRENESFKEKYFMNDSLGG